MDGQINTMSLYTNDGASTPDNSESGDSCSLSTPATERSLLFGDLPDISPLLSATVADQYILVVGGLGYIGSHTTWELLKEGYNVVIVDNLSNSFRSVFDRLQSMTKEYFMTRGQDIYPSLEFFETDYRDLAALKEVLSKYARTSSHDSSSGSDNDDDSDNENGNSRPSSRIRGVIHFAGYKAVAESIRQPLKYYSNNVGGLIDFCSVLSDFGIKTFVFSSSATVYGGVAKQGRLKEDHCTHATVAFVDENGQLETTYGGCTGLTNPYGRTKWMCEAILNDLAIADPEWTVFALRYFNPIGCDESGKLGEDPRATPNNLMPVVVRVLTEDQPVLEVYGTDWDTDDGTAVR